MSGSHRFYFKYCRNGHMIYANDTRPNQPRCERCGEEYIETCGKCNALVSNTFTSRVYFTNGQPTGFPKRPEFCRECGHAFPWTNAVHQKIEASGIWALLHPHVVEIAKSRFDSGHYADAVEAALKELNGKVKTIYFQATGNELDGVPLMRKAFSPLKPVIALDDLNTETGRNIQQGYLDIFAGAMAGIRNPKAHGNLNISAERASHYLMVASMLFFKLDEKL